MTKNLTYENHLVTNLFYNGVLTRSSNKFYAFARFNENEISAGELRQVYNNKLLYVNQQEVFHESWGLIHKTKDENKKLEIGKEILVSYPSEKDWESKSKYDKNYSVIIKVPDDNNNKYYYCYRIGHRTQAKVSDYLMFGLLNDQLYVLLAVDMNSGLFRTHGGHVELGETGKDAGKRESEEESDFNINQKNIISTFEIKRVLDAEIQESRRGYVVNVTEEELTDYNISDSNVIVKTIDQNPTERSLTIQGNQLLRAYVPSGNTIVSTVVVNLCTIKADDLNRCGLSNDKSEQLYTFFVHVDGLNFIRKNRLFQWDMHSAIVEEGLSFCRKYLKIEMDKQKSILVDLVKIIEKHKDPNTNTNDSINKIINNNAK